MDILLLSETWLTEDNKFKLPRMDLIRKDRTLTKGGSVAIGIRKGINYEILKSNNSFPNSNEIEIVAGKLMMKKSKNIILASLYRPPNYMTTEDIWNKIIQKIINMDPSCHVIIGRDLNAQSQNWGSKNNNSSGTNLQKQIFHHNLSVINDESPTYYSVNSGFNVLDLTMACNALTLKYSWETIDDLMRCYHFPIKITINVELNCSKYRRPTWSRKKVDWEIFSSDWKRNPKTS